MSGITVTACVTNKCNLRCLYCIAGCNRETADRVTEIDFSAMVEWLLKHFPSCDLHISGGEPLMIDDFVGKTQMCVENGFQVSVFSNALLLGSIAGIGDIDVKWHLTHHPESGVPLDIFLKNVEVVSHRKHVISRVAIGRSALNNYLEEESKYPAKPMWMNQNTGYRGFNKPLRRGNPNKEIILIGIDGSVHNCSHPFHGAIGNIYDMTLDTDKLNAYKCRCGAYGKTCQAQQSATIMRDL